MNPEAQNPLHASQCLDWACGLDDAHACMPDGGPWFLKPEAVRWAGQLAGLEPVWIQALSERADRFAADRSAAAMLWHWHRGLIDPGGWSVSHTTHWPIADEPARAGAYALLVLSGVRRLHERFSARGISEAVIRDTLRDVRRAMGRCVDGLGCPGVMKMRWLTHHLTLRLIELGRLQFEMGKADTKLDAAECDRLRVDPTPLAAHGLTLDSPVLWVHIPAAGPMPPDACDVAFARAREFFSEHFPEHAPVALLCRSWLMDRQLADYLPASSNILRFQSRFDLLPIEQDSDEVQRFVFGRVYEDLAEAPQRTALERAIVRHLRGGGVWRTGLGRLAR